MLAGLPKVLTPSAANWHSRSIHPAGRKDEPARRANTSTAWMELYTLRMIIERRSDEDE